MKTLYKDNLPFEVEEYPTVEDGIKAEMSHGELSAAFLVGDKLWSIDRATPYARSIYIDKGYTLFDTDIMGTTTGYSLCPEPEKELI